MYIYSSIHDWSAPINYGYSKYEGPEFLNSYFSSREDCISKIVTLMKNVHERIGKNSSSEKKITKSTTEALARLLEQIKIHRLLPVEFLFFVKKFEITKILYDLYDHKDKKGAGSFSNLRNYLLLSYCSLEVHRENGSLKFLNTSLKLNDLLVAELNQINNVEDFIMFKDILNLELKMVKKLSESIS